MQLYVVSKKKFFKIAFVKTCQISAFQMHIFTECKKIEQQHKFRLPILFYFYSGWILLWYELRLKLGMNLLLI
jgi:hypothetical protein